VARKKINMEVRRVQISIRMKYYDEAEQVAKNLRIGVSNVIANRYEEWWERHIASEETERQV
jgi:hypothetical protein